MSSFFTDKSYAAYFSSLFLTSSLPHLMGSSSSFPWLHQGTYYLPFLNCCAWPPFIIFSTKMYVQPARWSPVLGL